MFPKDLQLELEYWAETGDYDLDELHEVGYFAFRPREKNSTEPCSILMTQCNRVTGRHTGPENLEPRHPLSCSVWRSFAHGRVVVERS